MKLIYFFLLFLATSIHSAYAQNETYAKPSGFVPEGYALCGRMSLTTIRKPSLTKNGGSKQEIMAGGEIMNCKTM